VALTLTVSTTGGEDAPAGRRSRPPLRELVVAAAEKAAGGAAVEIVDTSGDNGELVDAVIWDTDVSPVVWPRQWHTTPSAYVEVFAGEIEPPRNLGRTRAVPSGALRPAELRVSALHIDEAIAVIAAWLEGAIAVGLSVEEHQMLEVVVSAFREVLSDSSVVTQLSKEVAAQVESALATVEAQYRAPRPSRKVLSWALGQLQQIPAGFISGLAVNYLPTLIRHFA
jgi:hypothetical protein